MLVKTISNSMKGGGWNCWQTLGKTISLICEVCDWYKNCKLAENTHVDFQKASLWSILAIRQLIEDDRPEIAVSYRSPQLIISKGLSYRRLSARWVLWLWSDWRPESKSSYVEWKARAERDDFVSRISSVMRCRCIITPEKHRLGNPQLALLQKKFFRPFFRSALLIDFLRKRHPVNAAHYCQYLAEANWPFDKKAVISIRSLTLLHENAQPNASALIGEDIKKIR